MSSIAAARRCSQINEERYESAAAKACGRMTGVRSVLCSSLALLALTVSACNSDDQPAVSGPAAASVRITTDLADRVLSGPGLPARGRPCHKRIRAGNPSGWEYSSVAAVRGATCERAVAVVAALAERVRERSDAGADCYPGYCTLEPAPRIRGLKCDWHSLSDGLGRITCHDKSTVVDAAVVADN